MHQCACYLCLLTAAGNMAAGSWDCFTETNQMYTYKKREILMRRYTNAILYRCGEKRASTSRIHNETKWNYRETLTPLCVL